MKIKPENDRILVRINKAGEQTTQTGLILPEIAEGAIIQGEILAVGPGLLLDNGEILPFGYKSGDVVLFDKDSGISMHQYEKDTLLLSWTEVLATLEP